MALKIKCADTSPSPARPAPPRDTSLELRTCKKTGVPYVRGTTHDGKKFRLFDITPNGIVLRRSNNHRDLGIAVDYNGKLRIS